MNQGAVRQSIGNWWLLVVVLLVVLVAILFLARMG